MCKCKGDAPTDKGSGSHDTGSRVPVQCGDTANLKRALTEQVLYSTAGLVQGVVLLVAGTVYEFKKTHHHALPDFDASLLGFHITNATFGIILLLAGYLAISLTRYRVTTTDSTDSGGGDNPLPQPTPPVQSTWWVNIAKWVIAWLTKISAGDNPRWWQRAVRVLVRFLTWLLNLITGDQLKNRIVCPTRRGIVVPVQCANQEFWTQALKYQIWYSIAGMILGWVCIFLGSLMVITGHLTPKEWYLSFGDMELKNIPAGLVLMAIGLGIQSLTRFDVEVQVPDPSAPPPPSEPPSNPAPNPGQPGSGDSPTPKL